MTQKGLNKYEKANAVMVVNEALIGASIPEALFSVGPYNFDLKNIQIASVALSDISTQFSQNNDNIIHQYLQLDQIIISFEFNVQKTIYPYFSDSGSGRLQLSTTTINLDGKLSIKEPTECSNFSSLYIGLINNSVQFYLSDINIFFDSDYDYIYDGMFQLLKGTLLDLLNTQIIPQFIEQALQTELDALATSDCGAHPLQNGYNQFVATGQYWRDIIVDQQYLLAKYNGEVFYFQNPYYYGGMINVSEPDLSYKTNNDVSYYIHLVNFQQEVNGTILYCNLTNLTYGPDEIVEFLQIVNTGGILRFKDALYKVDFYPIWYLENESEQNYCLYKTLNETQIGCYIDKQIIMDSSLCDDQSQTQDFIDFKNTYELSALTGYNSYNMDECNIIYVKSDLVVLTCQFKDVQ